jgi:sirohydrochlorin cobaltochelatase
VSGAALVLFAHGSSDPRWGEPLRVLQAALAARRPELPVLLAALKGGESLEDALARAAQLGASTALVVPVFLSGGGHLLRDVPELVRRAAASQPQLEVRCAATLGEQPEVVEAMAAACVRLLGS